MSTSADRVLARPAVLVLVTEDWFVVSHFLPLLRSLVALDLDVTVATRCAGKQHLIEAAGARVVPFDFKRGAIDPVADVGVVTGLRRLIRQIEPNVVHAIAMKPILFGGLLATVGTGIPVVLHLTGIGLAGTVASAHTRLVYQTVMGLIGLRLNGANARLLVENPDDKSRFARPTQAKYRRMIVLGGAGIDPDAYPALPEPPLQPVRVAYVGRMVWTKGVDVLVAAHGLIRQSGRPVELTLCGTPDPENPRAIATTTLEGWTGEPGISWRGFVTDVREVWRTAHIAVVPSRGGEGLPKSLLEAAACARPLIVTDVPGCRHFVRDGIEGLIVPPDDPAALASAIQRLAGDACLRRRLGSAARERVLSGFTERHVEAAVQDTYRDLLRLERIE